MNENSTSFYQLLMIDSKIISKGYGLKKEDL